MPRDFTIQSEEVIQANIIVNYKPIIVVDNQAYLAVLPNDASSSYIPSIQTYYYLANAPFVYKLSGVYSLKNTYQPYTMFVGDK